MSLKTNALYDGVMKTPPNRQLDVSFNEDSSRKRDGYAAQNFSMINRIALNLVKNEQSKKRSVKGKRLDAGWNNEYLLKILTN